MRIAVITPYYKEDISKLKRCHESVVSQTYKSTHFFVSDGFPLKKIDSWNVEHIKLPKAHGDYGDTPRLIGSMSAVTQGFDGICFLDADCWFEQNHIKELVTLAEEGKVDVVTATRTLRREDGTVLGVCEGSDGITFCDTNCYLITKTAFGVLPLWVLKGKEFAVIGDRILWKEILDRGYRTARCRIPTVNYETLFASHYIDRGEKPPRNAKVIMYMPETKEYKSVLYRNIKKEKK